ncbi:MAG: hypothetical protein JWL90_1366 [Chthoniobacteraceae bacterium]|nr:hypothetical protein [Chthoniobacteraceae bacterium]MDB6173644.1 hypothetical protein [Chthoniobacteraceae bacterium]
MQRTPIVPLYQQGQKSKANNIVDATDAFTGGELAMAA